MKEKIKENINNPEKLEQLFHENRKSFESNFESVFSEIEKTELAKYWKIRLDFDKITDEKKKISLSDILIMISACIIAGFLIKIPDLFNIKLTDLLFYERNAGIILFFGLTIYVVGINRIFDRKKLALIIIAFIIPAIYINLLPSFNDSDSINLAYIHLPLLMWCIFGLVYIGFNINDKTRRIEYIKYNGDLAILAALLLIAGGILTGITISLFAAIGFNIEKFYTHNIVIIGLVSVPIVATYIIKNYPIMTSKIATIIANIFSPLVLLTAIIFLAALAISGKDPYNDRNFLMMFNAMLFGVMAIIVFSISETSISGKQKFNEMILFFLSIITVLIDLIALSAIFYRLGTFGISPNRLAILGSNILILGNLVLIVIDLYKVNFKETKISKVELTISKYLPVYVIWILVVIFAFPFIFRMK